MHHTGRLLTLFLKVFPCLDAFQIKGRKRAGENPPGREAHLFLLGIFFIHFQFFCINRHISGLSTGFIYLQQKKVSFGEIWGLDYKFQNHPM